VYCIVLYRTVCIIVYCIVVYRIVCIIVYCSVPYCLYYCVLYCSVLTYTGTSVGKANRIRDGRPGFDSRQRQRISLFFIASRPVLGPTHIPTQWAVGADSVEVKRQRRGDKDSAPSSAEVKNGGAIPTLLHIRVSS
jgi:hypothetical protein